MDIEIGIKEEQTEIEIKEEASDPEFYISQEHKKVMFICISC